MFLFSLKKRLKLFCLRRHRRPAIWFCLFSLEKKQMANGRSTRIKYHDLNTRSLPSRLVTFFMRSLPSTCRYSRSLSAVFRRLPLLIFFMRSLSSTCHSAVWSSSVLFAEILLLAFYIKRIDKRTTIACLWQNAQLLLAYDYFRRTLWQNAQLLLAFYIKHIVWPSISKIVTFIYSSSVKQFSLSFYVTYILIIQCLYRSRQN